MYHYLQIFCQPYHCPKLVDQSTDACQTLFHTIHCDENKAKALKWCEQKQIKEKYFSIDQNAS
jgi:hypothetical protein